MREKVKKYALIALGSAVYAAGFRLFAYPNSIMAGGVAGIAMIVNYLTRLPVGALTIVMNVPLFLMAWKRFGTEFMLSSLAGMVLSSVFVDLLALTGVSATGDLLLAAVFAGVIKGAGLGIVYTTSATTGGVDIVAKFLRQKYQHINFSTLILAMDVLVVLAFGVIFRNYTSVMYSLISMYICSRVIDLVLYGTVDSKVCYIITDSSEPIKDAIIRELRRGVTYLHGEGAWSEKEKKIILCVIKPRQIVQLRKIVRELDKQAFVIVCDSHEVFGKNFLYIGADN